MGANNIKILLIFMVCIIAKSNAGPLAYAMCQAGCAAVVVACYSAGGAVFGTVTAGVGVAPAILACNTAFGQCSATCAACALIAPTP